jgi:uncharacterized membrane protein
MNTKQTITVWDGVKIGCGIFIVLPAILLVATILFLMLVPSCVKARNERMADKSEQDRLIERADTNHDGTLTQEEFNAEMQRMDESLRTD